MKCVICNGLFEKKEESHVQLSNRYAHKNCFDNSEAGQRIQLELYIKEIMKLDKISALIKRQIDRYNNELNYSYKSILFTLKYFYEVKKENPAKARGIGIVEYVYEEAAKYYANLSRAIENTANIVIKEPQKKIIEINSPQRKQKKKYVDLLSLKGE